MKTIFTSLLITCLSTIALAQTISCGSNIFWTVNGSGAVQEFTLSGGIVTYTGLVVPSTALGGLGIAFCNNLNGGTPSPTFYNSATLTGSATYYDGTKWVTGAGTYLTSLNNPGGYGNYLYYMTFPASGGFGVVRYNGLSFSNVYRDTVNRMGLADIAVDAHGNFWIFTSDSIGFSTYIDMVSPTGQVLNHYNFVFNHQHAYGSFFLNNILYVAFGKNNPINPDVLMPITFTTDTAIAGAFISFPHSDYADLASCNPGVALGAGAVKANTAVAIYPVPTADALHITLPSAPAVLTLYNLLGQPLWSRMESEENSTVDVSALPNGLYTLRIARAGTVQTRKFIVQH